MENKILNVNKQTVIQFLSALAIVALMMLGVYYFVIYEHPAKMNKMEEIETSSEIPSTDPSETAAKFIKRNGTMGNVENDITEESIESGSAVSHNPHRRLLALRKVAEATVDGSPLITSSQEGHIKTFARDLDVPYIYEIKNLEVSDPIEKGKITVHSEVGPSEYESSEVIANFTSNRINYNHARDTTYDGTHTQYSNEKDFENIKVTLVKSGDLWFVYDIEDSEELLADRFATWKGAARFKIDGDNVKETGEFIMEGIEPAEEVGEHE